MRNAMKGLVLVLLSAAPAHAQQAEVMAVVTRFIEGFNKGDVAGAVATCVPQAPIVDEFAPYYWRGCDVWATAYDADAKQKGITEPVVTMGKALHVFVTGTDAYVVVPTGYDYKLKGKLVKQTGSTITASLKKIGAAWKITAWSWAQGQEK